jgi:hypothetical protein
MTSFFFARKKPPMNTIGYYVTLTIMCIVVIIALGLSSFAITTHSTQIQNEEVSNNLINDVTINNDLQVTSNMNCQTQLITKAQCVINGSLTAKTLHIANSVTVGTEIISGLDAQVFVNSTQVAQFSQSVPIVFTVTPNGSLLTKIVNMSGFTFKQLSGEPSFFQMGSNTMQETFRFLILPTSEYAISVRCQFHISAQPSQAVELQASLAAYDSNMIYASQTNNTSAIVTDFTIALSGTSSFTLNTFINVPVLNNFTLFGIQLLLIYSLPNNLDSPIVTLDSLLIDVYRLN